MLKGETTPGEKVFAILLIALLGAAAAALVALGNPGNMGLCGACFLRDWAGALGFLAGKGPACFRPEVAGVLLGALALAVLRGRFEARSGGHAASRLLLGAWMGVAALVFLGCPFRMLQRLGGGDLNAWVALPGFLAGVWVALRFEGKGYGAGKTSPAPWPLGLLGPLAALVLLAVFLRGGHLMGPGPGDPAKPPHAPWMWALLIALPAGAVLSATGFCAISAARQVFQPRKAMLWAALALVGGYAATAAATGKFHGGFAGQPIAHGDLLWNILSLALLGLTGALAGGCPVRQMTMAGEGNGAAFVTLAGILGGAAVAHTLGLVSVPATPEAAGGPTALGKIAVSAGLVFALGYGLAMTRCCGKDPEGAPRA